MKTFVLGLVVVAGIMSSCSPKAKEETTLSGLNPKKFQAEIDGKQAGLYTLKNSAGMEVCITNFGGRIVHCGGGSRGNCRSSDGTGKGREVRRQA